MIKRTIGLAIVGSMLFGCVSVQTQVPTGKLTQAQAKQINAERQKIIKECRSRHEPLESAAWDCLGELVALAEPMGREYSESWASYLRKSQRIADKYASGAISEEDALERMSRMVGQLALDMQVLEQQLEDQSEDEPPVVRS
jgi:hypothetical protein